jgi:fatty-acyl-CoA synthase
MFVDLTFIPLVEALKDRFGTVRKYIVLTDSDHMPDTSLPNVVAYEDWIGAVDDDFEWGSFDENTAAALCYTSGTTGNPKGVLYSHRSNVLHGLTVNQPDVFGLTSEDIIMAIVPMFHANAWALTYAAPAAGAKLVMPGAGMDGKSIYELLEDEKVSATAAVPTVWLGLLQYLDETGKKLPYLQKVVVGGAACPPMMIRRFENDFDVEVIHGWGMTEMSPVGTTGKLKHSTMGLDREAQLKLKEKQGRTPYLVEMKIVDDDGNDLPRDGKVFGHLLVRGPAVSKGYFKLDDEVLTEDGWFDTGDIATIDPLGFMQITDRDKDVIKSGGEWISSIEIENEAVGCPGVAEAAVIGLPHPRWSERPLLIIIRDAGSDIDKEGVLAYLDGKIAKWWMPDDVVFVDEIPHTATGKIQKMELRKQFKNFKLED